MNESLSEHLRYFDVHTHLHDARISSATRHLLDRARKAGVVQVATCATMEENFPDTAALARSFPGVVPCFGIHPWFLGSLSPDWTGVLGDQLSRLPSAVGETGLDFMDRGADRDLQLAVFQAHLHLAMDLGRPVNIHVRKAWDAVVHILKKTGPLKAGGVVHSFSGSADLARVLTGYNLYISFSGAATRPNARKTVKALQAVSLDRIVFETDTPDLFPSLDRGPDFRHGPLNEPRYVVDVVEICARRRGMPARVLARHGFENALELYAPVLTPQG